MSVIVHRKLRLLLDQMTAFSEFNDESVLVKLFVKAWMKSVENGHGTANDGLTEFLVNEIAHGFLRRMIECGGFCVYPCHPCNPW